MSGFIKLHRKILKNWVYARDDYFKAWVWLLMEARYENTERTDLINNKLVKWKRGELIASVRFLQKAWRWKSKQKVETFLKILENEGMIARNVGQQISHITICKYDTYNDSKDSKKDRGRTEVGQGKDRGRTEVGQNRKKGKKGEEGKEGKENIPIESDFENLENSNESLIELQKNLAANFEAQVKADRVFLEAVQAQTFFTPEMTLKAAKNFNLELIAKGEFSHKHFSGWRKHFFNWIKYQKITNYAKSGFKINGKGDSGNHRTESAPVSDFSKYH